jgi:hypothetical protein
MMIRFNRLYGFSVYMGFKVAPKGDGERWVKGSHWGVGLTVHIPDTLNRTGILNNH